ncbi:MAG: hypothetical protein HeimC3_12400 [Candidatus Heimdallarchaeota archaeon LC_3]|nr:MAG: hypothetical protein HeimC3_12400 [Candidatus Heimdallarchaeota archaeon LC_3]
MEDLISPISDISIIVAIENIGPVLKSSTSKEMISDQNDANIVLYFTQRVVFSLGFGNEQVEFNKFHGPLSLIKTKTDKGLLLPIKFKDTDSSDSRIVQFGRDVIFVLQFLESDYNLIQKHQMDLLQKSLEEIEISCPNFDYLPLKEEKTINKLAETLKEKLNRFMSLRLWADEHGSSLLHLGTLNSLTGLHRILAAQLVGTPAGLTIDKMNQKLSKDENKNIEEALQDLLDMGFINKKRIDESNFKYLVV